MVIFTYFWEMVVAAVILKVLLRTGHFSFITFSLWSIMLEWKIIDHRAFCRWRENTLSNWQCVFSSSTKVLFKLLRYFLPYIFLWWSIYAFFFAGNLYWVNCWELMWTTRMVTWRIASLRPILMRATPAHPRGERRSSHTDCVIRGAVILTRGTPSQVISMT